MNTSEAAIKYATIGFAVFPLHGLRADATCDCGHNCDQAGKHPLVKGWQRTIPSVRAAQSTWPAGTRRGIGLLCGPQSGVFAIDVDPRHGGERSLAKLEHAHGQQLPDTWRARTGSDGRHLLYRWPDDDGPEVRNSAGRLGAGLDVRGAGGYIVLPPTIHKSGHQYTWLTPPWDSPLADAPPWLLEQVRKAARAAAKRPAQTGAKVEPGRRHDALCSLLGLMRSWGAAEEVLCAAADAFVTYQCEPDPGRPLDNAKVLQTAQYVARNYNPNPLARLSVTHHL